MIGDTGCCGANLQHGNVIIRFLTTFALLIIILCVISVPTLVVMSKINPRIKKIKKLIIVIIVANFRFIHNAPLNPKSRCKLAGKIFSYSPKFSGIIYRYFNVAVLILLWLGIIFSLYFIVSFKGS